MAKSFSANTKFSMFIDSAVMIPIATCGIPKLYVTFNKNPSDEVTAHNLRHFKSCKTKAKIDIK